MTETPIVIETTDWVAIVRLGDHYLAAEWPRGYAPPAVRDMQDVLHGARMYAEELLRDEALALRDPEQAILLSVMPPCGRVSWFSLQHVRSTSWLPSHRLGGMQ